MSATLPSRVANRLLPAPLGPSTATSRTGPSRGGRSRIRFARAPKVSPPIGAPSGRRVDSGCGTSWSGGGPGFRRGARWDERKSPGWAGLDEAPEGVGVEVFLDEIAEHVEGAFAHLREAGVRRDREAVPARLPR